MGSIFQSIDAFMDSIINNWVEAIPFLFLLVFAFFFFQLFLWAGLFQKQGKMLKKGKQIILCIVSIILFVLGVSFLWSYVAEDKKELEAYQSEIDEVCGQAILERQDDPVNYDGYRIISNIPKFYMDIQGFNKEDLESFIYPGQDVNYWESIKQIACIVPHYVPTGKVYSGISSGGIKAVKIQWQVYLVDVSQKKVTASHFFIGADPPASINSNMIDHEPFSSCFCYGREPVDNYTEWLDSLPIIE